jgi:signal transduction histidine kinase
VIFTVKDTGLGIAPEEKDYIFDPFYQGKNVPHASNQGTGLGLALVKSLVDNLQGTITFSSEFAPKSNWFETSFRLSLPQVKS